MTSTARHSVAFLVLCLLFTILSCDSGDPSDEAYKLGFREGYQKGYSEGGVAGHQDGYLIGSKDGYEQGYSDGFQERHKDISIVDLSVRKSIQTSTRRFAIFFFICNIVLLSIVILYLVTSRWRNTNIVIAKVAFALMALAGAFLMLRALGPGRILAPDLSVTQQWLVIWCVAPFVFIIGFILRRMVIRLDTVYSDVVAEVSSVLVLTYFLYFLTDLSLFLLQNEFASSCVLSASVGGLALTGYSLIDSKRQGDASSD